MSFNEWKKLVEGALLQSCGVTSDDLPDYPYYASYEAGESPEDVAEDVLRCAM